MSTDFRYVWQGTNPDVGQRFRMFVLDEKLRDAEYLVILKSCSLLQACVRDT